MPPKRRVTRTVRKSTAKKPSAASDIPPPPSSSPPEVAAVAAVADLNPEVTPVAVESSAPAASQTPISEITAASDASRPVSAPTPPPPAVPAEKSPKPRDVSTVPAAADAVPEPQTHAAPPPAATEPVAAEAPHAAAVAVAESHQPQVPARKTTTRVVKKVVKKIVKRKVPKVTATSSSLVPKPEEEKKEASVAGKETPEAVEVVDKKPASVKPEEQKTSPQVVLDRKLKNNSLGAVSAKAEEMEKDNVDSGGTKYAPMEEDKSDNREAAAAETTVTSFGDDEVGISERQKRRKTEIFIGGLDRDAKEEDVRKVFEKAGEILEIRMMMNAQTGKNKGYAFVRYKEAAQAKKAVSEFSKVEICGKLCGAAALEGNDTIFLGNIDKKWKKEDVIKLLQDIGIEKIDTVTVMVDPNNTDLNRGFAFLELETNRDAQIAYKKLQKKDVFGNGRNIKVSWAEPLNNPDEEEMQKVKSVYVESIPSSWDETKVRECFKKFGDIERVVLARNMQSAKRKDFAFVNYTTREAALSCIESFEKDELLGNGSKVNIKVSLAKPVRKGKQNKGMKSNAEKEKPKPVTHGIKTNFSEKGKSIRGSTSTSSRAKTSSTTDELLNVLREQAAWRQAPTSYTRGPAVPEYSHTVAGGKRTFPELGDDLSYSRGYPRARLDSSYQVPSYGALTQGRPGLSVPYYQRPDVGNSSGSFYGAPETRQASSNLQRQGFPPYGSNMYPRY